MNILLVEDNDVEVQLLERCLNKMDDVGSLIRARDGVEALELLKKDLITSDIPRPCLILLDINMPRMNGHEFLVSLRETDGLKDAMVFVFTTSESRKDIELAYANHANGYIVKPHSTSELKDVMTALQKFWGICRHPDESTTMH